jgi:hypothetical protein
MEAMTRVGIFCLLTSRAICLLEPPVQRETTICHSRRVNVFRSLTVIFFLQVKLGAWLSASGVAQDLRFRAGVLLKDAKSRMPGTQPYRAGDPALLLGRRTPRSGSSV